MVFKAFRLNCAVRVVLIAVNWLVFALLLSSGQYVTLSFLAALAVLQTYSLIRYVEYTNRSLDLFLQSIDFSDYSQRLYPGPAGESFAGLRRTFERILSRFRDMSQAREEDLRYHQALVQHVGIGLVVFDTAGNVALLNAAAKSLLDVPHLRTLADLDEISTELAERIRNLQPGRRDLVTLSVNDELLQLSLNATQLRRQKESVTLVSIQNISLELNEKEMEAWQYLIRVLTHEIKNSLTPIASLAASVEQLTGPGNAGPRTAPDPKIREALQVIQKRSQGLLQFVDTYRDLTHTPKPEFKMFPVAELFLRVERLIEPQISRRPVSFRTSIEPPGMTLTADPELIDQVLINLVLNSLEATRSEEGAEISIDARFDDRSRPIILVTDNGPGIVEDSLDKVFVPFYSTKKGGSGIGLSLSRQIMRLHRGDLTVRSEPDTQTTFTLRF
jgi:signal transduction histidine kinase